MSYEPPFPPAPSPAESISAPAPRSAPLSLAARRAASRDRVINRNVRRQAVAAAKKRAIAAGLDPASAVVIEEDIEFARQIVSARIGAPLSESQAAFPIPRARLPLASPAPGSSVTDTVDRPGLPVAPGSAIRNTPIDARQPQGVPGSSISRAADFSLPPVTLDLESRPSPTSLNIIDPTMR